jgi:hypothetical protein
LPPAVDTDPPSTRSAPPGRSTPSPPSVPLPGPPAPGHDRTTVSLRGPSLSYAVPPVSQTTSRSLITPWRLFSAKEPIFTTHCILPGPSRRSTPAGCWRVCNRRVGSWLRKIGRGTKWRSGKCR